STISFTHTRIHLFTPLLTHLLTFRLFSTKFAKASCARRKRRQFKSLCRLLRSHDRAESEKMSMSAPIKRIQRCAESPARSLPALPLPCSVPVADKIDAGENAHNFAAAGRKPAGFAREEKPVAFVQIYHHVECRQWPSHDFAHRHLHRVAAIVQYPRQRHFVD